MATTSIEWTEATWNPVVGCTKISPGCAHCYAETMAARLKAMALADIKVGKDPGRKRHYIDAIDDKGRWSGKLIPVPEGLLRMSNQELEDKIKNVLKDLLLNRAELEESLDNHTHPVVTWPDMPSQLIRENGRVDFDVAILETIKLLTEIRDLLQAHVR